MTNTPIGVVPVLESIPEIPSQIARGLLYKYEQDDELIDKLIEDVSIWLEKELKRGVAFKSISNPEQTHRMGKIFGSKARIFKRSAATGQLSRDFDIVVQALGAGCEFIATNNYRSIDHKLLNESVRSEIGLNADFIGLPDGLTERYLKDTEKVALTIGAMSVAKTERTVIAETASFNHFCTKLDSTFNDTGLLAKTAFDCGLWTPSEFFDQARNLANTPRFMQTRRMGEELQILRLDALAWGIEEGICELDDIERKEVEEHQSHEDQNRLER